MRKSISIAVLAAFVLTSIKAPAFAQLVDPMPPMPVPGTMVHLSPEYTPAYLKGIVIHPENALKFDFIIFKGDKELEGDQKRQEYTKLAKYFLASLAIPDDDQWVNLSPYEKDRIIKQDFGKTEMGRDLLAQDYLLKQITASLIYPEDKLGKEFWDRVYSKAQAQFGTSNIPVNTFNKVWILPDDALIYEKGNTAYVLRNHLRVMLEEDYLSLKKHEGIQSVPANPTHTIASQIIRKIVLPELEREVNTDENFAPLRQVYSGMLLAAWYKKALKESLLSRIYADKAKVKGVDQDPRTNEEIYRQYLKAYKKGVFNFIREDVDKYTNETIPRKYFSGGEENYAMAARELGQPVIHNISVTNREQSSAITQEITDNKDELVRFEAREFNPARPATAGNANSGNRNAAMTTVRIDKNNVVLFYLSALKSRENSETFNRYNKRMADIVLRAKGNSADLIDIARFFTQTKRPVEGEEDLNHLKQRVKQLLAVISEAHSNITDSTDPKGYYKLMNNIVNFLNYFQSMDDETTGYRTVLDFVKTHGKNGPIGNFNNEDMVLPVEPEFVSFISKQMSVGQGLLALGWKTPDLPSSRMNVFVPKTEIGGGEGSAQEVIDQKIRDVASKNNLSIRGKVTVTQKDNLGYNVTFTLSNQAMASQPNKVLKPGQWQVLSHGTTSSPVEIVRGNDRSIRIQRVDGSEYGEISVQGDIYDTHAQLLKQPSHNYSVVARNANGDVVADRRIITGQPLLDKNKVSAHEILNLLMDRAMTEAVPQGNKIAFRVDQKFQTIREAVEERLQQEGLSWSDLGSIDIMATGKTFSDRDELWITDFNDPFLNTRYYDLVVDFEGGLKDRAQAAVRRNVSVLARTSELSRPAEGNFEKGGIDLNAANLNLQIKRDGHGVPLPISQQDLDNIHIEGLVPVMLDIKPAAQTPLLSELQPEALR